MKWNAYAQLSQPVYYIVKKSKSEYVLCIEVFSNVWMNSEPFSQHTMHMSANHPPRHRVLFTELQILHQKICLVQLPIFPAFFILSCPFSRSKPSKESRILKKRLCGKHPISTSRLQTVTNIIHVPDITIGKDRDSESILDGPDGFPVGLDFLLVFLISGPAMDS
ncbi:hypothetical protein ACFX19_027947 [Malus domestica]